jgi:hypothetical protein
MTARIVFVFVLGAAACRGPLPCPDCDDAADDMQEDLPPDLPCGGADLMTDLYNCGSCGNDCSQRFSHTQWVDGSCQDGVCGGAGWMECEGEYYGSTCEELCAGPGVKCVANGCSGYTALLFWGGGDFDVCDVPPYATMDGACDEPIPWEGEYWDGTQVMCCCG